VSFDPVEKPGVANLLTILAAVTGRKVEEVTGDFEGQGYGALKGADELGWRALAGEEPVCYRHQLAGGEGLLKEIHARGE